MMFINVKYHPLVYALFLMTTVPLKAQPAEKSKGYITSTNDEPVAYAHVYFQNRSAIAISNVRGEFFLPDNAQGKDSIIISCIGYATRKISLEQWRKARFRIILEPGATTLENVVITDISARTIVERTIRSIGKFYSGSQLMLYGYFWNATREDSAYTRLQSQEIQWRYPESTVQLDREKDYGDHRVYKLDEINKFRETLTYEHLLSRRGFLNPENLDMWQFAITGFRKIGNQEYYEIKATFNAGSDSVDHKATLLINSKNFTLLTIDFEYKWNVMNLKRLADFYYNFTSATGQVRFVNYNGFYFPAYVKVVVVQTVHDLISRKQLSRQENYNEITLSVDHTSNFHPLSINAFEDALLDLKSAK